jgi:PAS domain S-box-containing protein
MSDDVLVAPESILLTSRANQPHSHHGETMSASTLTAVHEFPPVGHNHAVQFYESDDFLADTVADFIGKGLVAAEPVVVIATKEHRDSFAAALALRGLEVAEATASGDLLMIDAREALASFMAGNLPDPQRFRENVGGLIEKVARGRQKIRAYGEMVDLLWRDGNPDGAIRLEELWNDLSEHYSFNLLCAYPMGNFYSETHSAHFEEVCRTHSHVYPAETISSAADSQALARQIAVLQQQARALTSEIEHRKGLEGALRDSLAGRRKAEQDLQDFVDNATIGLHWVGPDGTILWANKAELELLGYPRDEYVGHNIAEFHADADAIADILRRLAAKEAIYDYEAPLRAKDGSIRHVAISSNVLFEEDQFIHTRCFTRDITERKELERAAQRTSEDNAFLLKATTALNRSLQYDERLRDVAELAVPRLADWCAVNAGSDEHGGERPAVACGDEPANHDDGARLTIPMRVGDQPFGAITFARTMRYDEADITLATEFGRRAAAALENARLYHLAQEANRIKDQFLATLSHELRTPLTAILGWSRMLTLGGLDPETMRTACGTIERAARTQAALIDDLLDLSKVVTGKLALRNEPVELGAVISGAMETLQLAAETKGIRLDIAPIADRAIVNGDPTRLQQIAWNLVSNAIKFSDAGGSVLIAVERRNESARIIVRDEGRGIAAEFLPHVFDPFRQADGAITREHGGLGLGLAIVKYLAELHGGSVTANSAGEGQGATFVVTLPLITRRLPKIETPAFPDEADLTGVAVLVVDDDRDTRNLVAAMLRRAGSTVVTAESVGSATSALSVMTPDVIVTDLSMPGGDGFAFLRELHGDERRRNIPVVALTASTEEHAQQRVRAAGFDAYVRKPIDPLQFVGVVAQLYRAPR